MSNILSSILETGTKRQLSPKLARILQSIAAIIALGVIYTTTIVYVDLFAMTIVFLSSMLALLFLMYTSGSRGRTDSPSLIDWVLSLTSVAAGVYFIVESSRIVERITLLFPLEMPDLIAGSALFFLTIKKNLKISGHLECLNQ